MCLEMRHRWSCAVSGNYIPGESGYVQERCQCLNPLAGGKWGEWEEENMRKSCDIPALGWGPVPDREAQLERLSSFLPLETHSGNEFLSTSRKAINGGESRFLMRERQSGKKVMPCVFSACTESELQSRDPKVSDQVKWK